MNEIGLTSLQVAKVIVALCSLELLVLCGIAIASKVNEGKVDFRMINDVALGIVSFALGALTIMLILVWRNG